MDIFLFLIYRIKDGFKGNSVYYVFYFVVDCSGFWERIVGGYR